MIARALALRGDALFFVGENRLVAASDWDVSTRDGEPVAYRLTISEAGGGRTMTALAGEVLHVRIGADPAAPWIGQAPLRRAALTAGLLHALESALCEIFENAPLGSQIVPFPESPQTDNERLSRGFRGRRGAVLLRESVNVTAAGGPAPQADWRPNDLSPDISRTQTLQHVAAAREAIAGAFGVLPALLSPQTTGPLVREAQRHLAQWVLQPIAELIAEEARLKLVAAVDLDVISPLQAFDQGGRARALGAYIEAIAAAKAANLSADELSTALKFIDEGTPREM
jgi:phage portal protein BeeE